MHLCKVHIKTYKFGIYYFDLFVLAKDDREMAKVVYQHPLYKNDEVAEIDSWNWIDIDNGEARVL